MSNTPPPKTITFRASPVLQKRVDELAASYGGNRSKAIQAAVLQAGEATKEGDVPDEAEVLRLLGEAARSGSVSAMKELRAYHREHSQPDKPEDFIEELERYANSGS